MKAKKSRLEVFLTIIVVGGIMGCSNFPETLPYEKSTISNEIATKAYSTDSPSSPLDSMASTCPYCYYSLTNCTCNRCPECGNTADKCYCQGSTPCPKCGQVGGLCDCHNICQGCGKPTFACECPSSTTDPTLCPTCGNSHSATEPCSTSSTCHCGSALCNGIPNLCTCKESGYCKNKGNCICTGKDVAKPSY